MAAVAVKVSSHDEELSEAVSQFLVLYDKSCKYFKDKNKKRLAWQDVANKLESNPVCIATEITF